MNVHKTHIHFQGLSVPLIVYEINRSTINYYDLQSPSQIYKPDLMVHTKMSPL